MTIHPGLLQAIVLAAIVKLPDHTKRQLVSRAPERRHRAEEAFAASVVIALAQRR